MTSIPERIARELRLRAAAVKAAVELLDAGNTLPFIARYRKEAIGGLDDAQLTTIFDRLALARALEQRRQVVLG